MSGIAIDIFSDIVLRPAWWLGKNIMYYVFYGGYYLIVRKPKNPLEKQEKHLENVEKKLDNLIEIIYSLDPEKVQKILDLQELRDSGFVILDKDIQINDDDKTKYNFIERVDQQSL